MPEADPARLTTHARSGGCAAKLNPIDLRAIVKEFAGAAKEDPNLLVGFETGDDAGVYRLDDRTALVQTVDYITPVVDDPYVFGQIAAANAISDVYAMGGRPITALNCCCFPSKNIDTASLRRILEGGFSKIREAGATLVGGHTVRDDELKYGLAVTGLIDPGRILTNAAARPGDRLVLTKPIGTGVIINGFRRGQIDSAVLERAVGWMAMLNRVACETMLAFDVHACTDITGFGLAGHALGMANGSGTTFRFRYADVPRYDESLALIAQGVGTAVTNANLEAARDRLTFSGSFTDAERTLVGDPQTSGGLLIALPADEAPRLVALLRERGHAAAADVGEVVPPAGGGPPRLEFLK